MNSKMTTNSQLSTTEPKKYQKQKQTKQTTRTGAGAEKWRSHGGFSAGKGRRERGNRYRNKKHKWQVQNRQGEVKKIMGNGEAKELICMTHGHELRRGVLEGETAQGGGG